MAPTARLIEISPIAVSGPEAASEKPADRRSRGEATVPNPEDEKPDPDDLDLFIDIPDETEPSAAADGSDVGEPPDAGATAPAEEEAKEELSEDVDQAETAKEPKKGKKKGKKRKPRGKKQKVDKEGDEKPGGNLLEAIANASPYTVMLALALLAIVIAVFCLYMELGRYDFEIKAKEPYTVVPAVQCGLASTTEAA